MMNAKACTAGEEENSSSSTTGTNKRPITAAQNDKSLTDTHLALKLIEFQCHMRTYSYPISYSSQRQESILQYLPSKLSMQLCIFIYRSN